MNYENRIVLFLDILGFKRLVLDTIDKDSEGIEVDKPKKIEDLYKVLSQMGLIAGANHSDSLTNVTQFSDSIVISFSDREPGQAVATFEIILRIIVEVVSHGIICRGALSYGKLIHDQRLIFGPALVDAYETESKAAMYPRVIMDKNIYNLARMYNDPTTGEFVIPPGIYQLLRLDGDGKYFIDYFGAANQVVSDPSALLAYYKKLREIIVNGRKFQQPDLKVKYGWMRSKYNRLLRKVVENSTEVSHLPPVLKQYLNGLKSLK